MKQGGHSWRRYRTPPDASVCDVKRTIPWLTFIECEILYNWSTELVILKEKLWTYDGMLITELIEDWIWHGQLLCFLQVEMTSSNHSLSLPCSFPVFHVTSLCLYDVCWVSTRFLVYFVCVFVCLFPVYRGISPDRYSIYRYRTRYRFNMLWFGRQGWTPGGVNGLYLGFDNKCLSNFLFPHIVTPRPRTPPPTPFRSWGLLTQLNSCQVLNPTHVKQCCTQLNSL